MVRPDGTKHSVGFHGGYDEPDKWSVQDDPYVLLTSHLKLGHRIFLCAESGLSLMPRVPCWRSHHPCFPILVDM